MGFYKTPNVFVFKSTYRMAVGFTPKHVEDFLFDDLSPNQFLALVFHTLNHMGMKIHFVSQNGVLAYSNNGNFSWNAEIKIGLETGKAVINSASAGSEMVDFGKNKKLVLAIIQNIEEQKAKLSTENLAHLYQEISVHFPPPEQDVFTMPPATSKEKIMDFLSIFTPTKGYFISPILVNLNLLVFVLMALTGTNVLEPDNESLLNWGANYRPYTLDGEWWRLLSACFIHIGILHLLMNLYALFLLQLC